MNRVVEILDDLEAPLEDLSDFIDLCRRGMRYPEQAAELVRMARGVSGVKENKARRLMAMMKKMASVAPRTKRHIESDFSYLFALAVVQLWTIFDATMTDFCIAYLEHDGLWKRVALTGNIKVALSEFIALSEPQQVRFVWDLALTETKARHAPGVARFETILKAVGLGGDVPDGVRKDILWLAEARHLLLHRQGIVDEKFVQRCPWSGLKVGDRLIPTYQDSPGRGAASEPTLPSSACAWRNEGWTP